MCDRNSCSNVSLDSAIRRASEALRAMHGAGNVPNADQRKVLAALRHQINAAMCKGGNVLASSNAMGG